MSTIRHALQKLDGAIDKLEGSVNSIEAAMEGQQRDMFKAPSNQNGAKKSNGKANGSASGPAIAQRLDSAIEKVELLLKEGRA